MTPKIMEALPFEFGGSKAGVSRSRISAAHRGVQLCYHSIRAPLASRFPSSAG